MKNIKDAQFSFDDLNRLFSRKLDAALWTFLLDRLHMKEIVKTDCGVKFPEYIPFEEVIAEVLRELDEEEFLPKPCRRCQAYFDINTAEGIFGDFDHLEHFVCRRCATQLSAWDFYHEYLHR